MMKANKLAQLKDIYEDSPADPANQNAISPVPLSSKEAVQSQ